MWVVDSSADLAARAWLRGRAAVVGLGLLAVLVAVGAALIDRATVKNQEELGRVAFGYPLRWLAQNQTNLDPSFPANLSPASPWENPTSVAFGPLCGDVLVVYVLLLVGWFAGRSVLRSVRASSL